MQDRVHLEYERMITAIQTIREAFRANLPKIKGKGSDGYFRVARCWRSTQYSTVIAFNCTDQTITIRRSGWGCDIKLQYLPKSTNIGEGFKLITKSTPYDAHYVDQILDEIVVRWADLVETYPAAQFYRDLYYHKHSDKPDPAKLWDGITITSLKQLGSTHFTPKINHKHYWDVIGDYEGSDTFNALAEQFVLERGFKWCHVINKFREELTQFCYRKRNSPENYAEFTRQVEIFAN